MAHHLTPQAHTDEGGVEMGGGRSLYRPPLGGDGATESNAAEKTLEDWVERGAKQEPSIRTRVSHNDSLEMDQVRANVNLDANKVNRSSKTIMSQTYWTPKIILMYTIWTWWALLLTIVLGSGGWAFPDGSNPSCNPNTPDRNKSVCGLVSVLQMGR